MRWFERIDAMGHGDVRPMDPDEALKIAKDGASATAENVDSKDPNELEAGTGVSITPDDYGFDPVTGRVVVSTIHEIAIEREVPELGKIVNHFPESFASRSPQPDRRSPRSQVEHYPHCRVQRQSQALPMVDKAPTQIGSRNTQ